MTSTTHFTRFAAVTSCLLALSAAACLDETPSPDEPQFGVSRGGDIRPNGFTVYTQNVYLGGDTGPLFSLDLNDPTQLPAILAATNQFWAEVQASSIPERVAELVDEIDARRPHVVALQEVLRFTVLDGSFRPTGGIDLLAAIEAGIASRDLPYETAVVQETTSAALPLGFDPAVGLTEYLAFTDRVVILRRSDVAAVETAQGLYAASFQLSATVELLRGWARLSVDHEGTTHHLVATHLETQGIGPIHDAQANELRNSIVAGLEGVTIIAGDLNSDAAASDGAPSWTPTYDKLIAAGFADVWSSSPKHRRASGVTCCQAPNLREDSELDERIDFILVRSSDDRAEHWGTMRGLFRAEVVGEERSDLTPEGLWPSDHAGLVATFRTPDAWR